MNATEETIRHALVADESIRAIRAFFTDDLPTREKALETMRRLAVWPLEAADAALRMPPDDFTKLKTLSDLILAWRAASDDGRDSSVLSTYRGQVRKLIRELAGFPADPEGRTP